MRRWLVIVIAMHLISLTVWAGDVLTLRDGRRVAGVVQRNIEGNVWIQPDGGKDVVFFSADQISTIELGPQCRC